MSWLREHELDLPPYTAVQSRCASMRSQNRQSRLVSTAWRLIDRKRKNAARRVAMRRFKALGGYHLPKWWEWSS